jgi:hypothetical protein
MALYLYSEYVRKAQPNKEFDKLYEPGQTTAWSGIYRCQGCGRKGKNILD